MTSLFIGSVLNFLVIVAKGFSVVPFLRSFG